MGPGIALAVWAVLGTAIGGIAWGISQYTSNDSDKVKVDKYDDDDDLDGHGWNAKETNTENNSESLSSEVTALGRTVWGISQYISNDSDKVKADKYDDDDELDGHGWNAKETNTENNSESLSSEVTALGRTVWGISQYISNDSDKVKADKYDDDDDLDGHGWNAKETNTENNSESLSSEVTALGRTVWGISQYISNDSDKVKVDKYDDDDDLDGHGWNAKETNTENNSESLSSKVTAFVFEAAPDHATESPISKNSKILRDTTSPVKLVYNANDDCYIWNAITAERHSSSSNVTTFDTEATAHRPIESPISKNSKILRVTNTLKIMSYNICSREEYPIHERMNAIGRLVQLHSPHFICFQEFTLEIYTIFQNSRWWGQYQCSISEEEASKRKLFCVLLSKYTLTEITNTPLGYSNMGRLSVATIRFGKRKSLVVASGHLKSPCPDPKSQDHKFKKERTLEANHAFSILNEYPNVIFCGDMNWDEKTDGNFPLPSGWIDAWKKLRGKEKGYTFDTHSNKMLNGHRHLRERLDRIFYKWKGKRFKVDNIDIIGKEAISDVNYKSKEKTLPVLPSDHYGLLLTFRM